MSLPRTPLGELTALRQTLSWFKGTLLLRGRGEEGKVEEERIGKARGEGREWRAGEGPPPHANSWIRPWFRPRTLRHVRSVPTHAEVSALYLNRRLNTPHIRRPTRGCQRTTLNSMHTACIELHLALVENFNHWYLQ